MASNYPASLDDTTNMPTRSSGETIPSSDNNDKSAAIIALETKLGIGAGGPDTPGRILTSAGSGASEWAELPSPPGAGDIGFTGTGTLTSGNVQSAINELDGTTVHSVVAGSGVSVDSTDPLHPVVSAAGGGGGGGGQTTVTAVVAATGGDYTTLGAAIAAASDGWTILVKSSTTETGAITSALNNLTIVGANPTGAVVALGSNVLNISGDGTAIFRLGVSISTGGLSIGGIGSSITHSRISLTGGGYVASMTGVNARFTNNYVVVSSGQSQSASRIYCAGNYASVSNNYLAVDANHTGFSSIEMGGQFASVTNNNISIIDNTTNGKIITVSGTQSSVIGNNIGSSAARSTTGVNTTGTFCNVSSNILYRVGTGVKIGASFNTVSANTIFTGSNPDVGIDVTGSSCTVNGNTMSTNFGAAPAIRINGGMDDCVVVGNRAANFPTGISVAAASNDRTVIVGNAMNSTTTPISDSGTGTIKATAAADAYNSV